MTSDNVNIKICNMKLDDLKKYRKRTDFTIEDVVLLASEMIPRLIGEQTRYKVTNSPDVRTIRFYTARGVLDKPLDYKGTRALYGYRHLLELLVIKYLQSESLPIRKIREIIEGKDEQELEKLLWPLFEYESGEGREAIFLLSARNKRSAYSREEARLLPPSRRFGPGEPPDFVLAYRVSEGLKKSQKWSRYEIEPGLELHINEDYQPPGGPSEQKILLSQIKKIFENLQERR